MARTMKKKTAGAGLTVEEAKVAFLTAEEREPEAPDIPAPIVGGLWWREFPAIRPFVLPRPPVGYNGLKALYMGPKGLIMPEGATPTRPLCQHKDCHNIGIWGDPALPLCATCRDIHRGVEEKGVRHAGGLPAWRGYKD